MSKTVKIDTSTPLERRIKASQQAEHRLYKLMNDIQRRPDLARKLKQILEDIK